MYLVIKTGISHFPVELMGHGGRQTMRLVRKVHKCSGKTVEEVKGAGFVILKKVARLGLMEKGTFEQSSERLCGGTVLHSEEQ